MKPPHSLSGVKLPTMSVTMVSKVVIYLVHSKSAVRRPFSYSSSNSPGMGSKMGKTNITRELSQNRTIERESLLRTFRIIDGSNDRFFKQRMA